MQPKDCQDLSNESVERAVAGYQQLVEILSAAHTPELPASGVTMAQLRVLMVLSVTGETRMSDLAAKLKITLSTLSSLVDRLVEAELVQRRTNEHDRRNVLVSLSDHGLEALDALQELGIHHLRALLALLDDAGLQTVNNALELLVAAARQSSPEDFS
jgi:DNA-binding MarR family transcriptional regulator